MLNNDPAYYIQGVREGNRRVLARTITMVESGLSAHQDLARTILDELLPETGRAVRLGALAGPPATLPESPGADSGADSSAARAVAAVRSLFDS